MNRSTAWYVALATLLSTTAAHAADPGFYFAATASRVEHDVDGRPGLLALVGAAHQGHLARCRCGLGIRGPFGSLHIHGFLSSARRQ